MNMATPPDLISALPPEIINNFSFIINILQAVGIAIGVYIIFNLINFFFSKRREKELKKINENLEAIKKLLARQSKKRG